MRTLKLLTLGMLVACAAGAADADSPATAGLRLAQPAIGASRPAGSSSRSTGCHRGATVMLGVGRTVEGGKTVSFEFLRIEPVAGEH